MNQCTLCTMDVYKEILQIRKAIIISSAVLLLANIVWIIIRRQYQYHPSLLFMIMEIFYLFAMLSVLFHDVSFSSGIYGIQSTQKICPNAKSYRSMMQQMIDNQQSYKTAFQGFFNLFCYNMSFLTAITTSNYVRQALKRKHISFLRTLKSQALCCALIIFLLLLVPFVLTFVKGVSFSFGPIGHGYKNCSNLFLFSGIIGREGTMITQSYIGMFIIPALLVFYHIKILIQVRKVIKHRISEAKDGRTVSTEEFMMKKMSDATNFISFIQFFNLAKKVLSLVESSIFQLIINCIFDCLPLGIIFIYFIYYRKAGRYRDQKQALFDLQPGWEDNKSIL